VLVACTIAANNGGPGGPGGGGEKRHNGQSGDGDGGAGGLGGILNASRAVSASLINTIVGSNLGGAGGAGAPSGNIGAPDLQGSFSSAGHNLIGQTDGSSGFTNGVNSDLAGSGSAPIDPLLGPLTDNGGPTFTMALLHGSPALDAGDDALLHGRDGLRTDQRGFARKSGSHMDIGAFEYQFGDRHGHSPAHVPILSGSISGKGNLKANMGLKGVDSAAPNFQLTFSDDTPGATFTVLATTNFSLPFDNWRVLGQPIRTGGDLFQFTDFETTNNAQRFYRVSSP
jgi:hypothetical protein